MEINIKSVCMYTQTIKKKGLRFRRRQSSTLTTESRRVSGTENSVKMGCFRKGVPRYKRSKCANLVFY